MPKSILSSMKTLDTLDSYSLVTWSGSQEDPNMVFKTKQNISTKILFPFSGLVNVARWDRGAPVERPQRGDDERKTDPSLPL